MAKKKRHTFTAEQKASILRRHHIEKVPVSQVCEEEDLQPSVFYYWQKQAFENLTGALQSSKKTNGREKALRAKVDKLEERLARKDHVIAVISEEHVALKKELGEP